MTRILERRVEDYLDSKVKELDGFTRKTIYQGRKSAPDRQVFFPNGLLYFVELKRPGEKPRVDQTRELSLLESFGQKVRVLDSMDAVDAFIEEVKKEIA